MRAGGVSLSTSHRCGIPDAVTKDGSAAYARLHLGLCTLTALTLIVSVVADRSPTSAAPAAAAQASSPTPAAPSTAAPTTISTPPPTTIVPDVVFPDVPVDDYQSETALYGWGTAQPTQMRATVHFGGTNRVLTRERRALLASQLVEVRAAAMGIGTVAEAERQGFVRNFQRIDGRGFEYINWSRFSSELDLSRPTLLAFEDDKPDSRIISVAYNVLGTIEDGPPRDLPLEVIPWHYHSNLCEVDDTIVGSVEYDADGQPYPEAVQRCVDLGATFRPELNHWMVDLWVVPGWENPWGLVSSKHPDMMFDPTPWFAAPVGDADGFGLYCRLPDGADPAPDDALGGA